jgi:hypothetical protein
VLSQLNFENNVEYKKIKGDIRKESKKDFKFKEEKSDDDKKEFKKDSENKEEKTDDNQEEPKKYSESTEEDTNDNKKDNEKMSFTIIFKQAVREVYSIKEVSDEDIQDVINNFNIVLTGAAKREKGKKDYDYTNCKIRSLPDFKSEISSEILYDDSDDEDYQDESDVENDSDEVMELSIEERVQELLDRFTFKHNWFENYMNEIHHNTTSNIYKLTVAGLNDRKISEVITGKGHKCNNSTNITPTNKTFTLDSESLKATNKAAEDEAGRAYDSTAKDVNKGFFGTIAAAVKAVWNWITSWWS